MAWLTGYGYRKKITLTEQSSTALSDYVVELDVTHVTDHMEADFADLRFTSDDETTELNYWIESQTASTTAKVFVEVPSIASSSTEDIYVYYGNDAVSTTSDIDGVSVDTTSGSTFSFAENVSGKTGVQLTTNQKIRIFSLEQTGSSSATIAYILNSGQSVLATSATIASSIGYFSGSYILADSTTYFFAFDNGGSTYSKYQDNTTSYPYARTPFNFISYLNHDGATGTIVFMQLENAKSAVVAGTVPTDSFGAEEAGSTDLEPIKVFDVRFG